MREGPAGRDWPPIGRLAGGGLEQGPSVWRRVEQTPDPERTVSDPAVSPGHHGKE